jgi:ATP-dependent Lon protease
MEIINISGYTLQEKREIAKQHLIPKQIKENGLKEEQIKITTPGLDKIIDEYTRESGVRSLEREIGSVCRGIAAKIAKGKDAPFKVGVNEVDEYLGKRKYFSEVAERTTVPGVATGLAWTPYGGDILFIEASVSKGSGKIHITGQLGDVMKESAMLAMSYLKAHSEELNIPEDAFKYWDLHIHVPKGAVPKDGPSAGVSIFSAVSSIFTQRKVKGTLAMTGEITLRGLVLPVGGIKEKVLAAKRAGIDKVLLPQKNEKDVHEIEDDVMGNMEVQYLERMDPILNTVLEDETVEDPGKYFTVSERHKSQNGSAQKSGDSQSETVVME